MRGSIILVLLLLVAGVARGAENRGERGDRGQRDDRDPRDRRFNNGPTATDQLRANEISNALAARRAEFEAQKAAARAAVQKRIDQITAAMEELATKEKQLRSDRDENTSKFTAVEKKVEKGLAFIGGEAPRVSNQFVTQLGHKKFASKENDVKVPDNSPIAARYRDLKNQRRVAEQYGIRAMAYAKSDDTGKEVPPAPATGPAPAAVTNLADARPKLLEAYQRDLAGILTAMGFKTDDVKPLGQAHAVWVQCMYGPERRQTIQDWDKKCAN